MENEQIHPDTLDFTTTKLTIQSDLVNISRIAWNHTTTLLYEVINIVFPLPCLSSLKLEWCPRQINTIQQQCNEAQLDLSCYKSQRMGMHSCTHAFMLLSYSRFLEINFLNRLMVRPQQVKSKHHFIGFRVFPICLPHQTKPISLTTSLAIGYRTHFVTISQVKSLSLWCG